MRSRFQQQNLDFMRQLAFFTPRALLTDTPVNSSDIELICQLYDVSSKDVSDELSDFKRTYRLLNQRQPDNNDIVGLGQLPNPVAAAAVTSSHTDAEIETVDAAESDNESECDVQPDYTTDHKFMLQTMTVMCFVGNNMLSQSH